MTPSKIAKLCDNILEKTIVLYKDRELIRYCVIFCKRLAISQVNLNRELGTLNARIKKLEKDKAHDAKGNAGEVRCTSPESKSSSDSLVSKA
jgi:hypothetical protein